MDGQISGPADTGPASDQTWSWSKRPDFSWTSLVFIPIFKYLVSSVLHGNLLCRHLQIIFISTAVILPKLYDVYIVHNIELQCWYLAMHPKTHGKVVEIASVPFFCLWSLKYVLPSNLQTCAIHWTKVKYINYGRLMFCSIGQMGQINCGLFSVFLVSLSANILSF